MAASNGADSRARVEGTTLATSAPCPLWAAYDAVLEASDKLAEAVRRQLAEPAEPED